MIRAIVFLTTIVSAFAFAPVGRTLQRSLSMDASGLIGAPAKNEIVGGYWDPLKLSVNKDTETINWYRSAELKHGRVCMVAALGIFIQELTADFAIPSPIFSEKNFLLAFSKVLAENPGAILQILIAISAVEVLGASIESKERPGDFGWDPANIRPTDADKLDILQTKELKNGRLAMLSVAGLALQDYVTGQGPLEQIASGNF